MRSLRVMLVGGLISYRALFNWLNPWIFVPSLLVAPIFQILLFAYIGRSAGLESDEFFVIGNALQYSAMPCFFAMMNTVVGERDQQTLGLVLSTPVRRVPLILGRSLPIIVNGWLVSLFSLVVGGAMLDVDIPLSAWVPIGLVAAAASASCTGLGLCNSAVAFRVRSHAVPAAFLFGVLLVFCGANVPVDTLPAWMQAVSDFLPLTHAVEAARLLADGATPSSVVDQVATELAIGAAYIVLGLALLAHLERTSRANATLELL